MKNSLKINDGTLKLLYILAGVILLAVAWLAVVQKVSEQNDTLETENKALTEQVERLRQMEAVKDKYIENTDEMELAIDEMLEGVPSEVRDDDKANIAALLRDHHKIEILSSSIQENEMLYPMGEKYKNSQDAGKYLYRSPYTLRCKVSYEDLKNCLEQFKEISEQRVLSIDEVKVSIDDETGLLIADISINMYYLEGSDVPYEPLPLQNDVQTGNENLFNAK